MFVKLMKDSEGILPEKEIVEAEAIPTTKFEEFKKLEKFISVDKREDFWGIYAREIISLRWVLFYNFICLLPMLAFFMV